MCKDFNTGQLRQVFFVCDRENDAQQPLHHVICGIEHRKEPHNHCDCHQSYSCDQKPTQPVLRIGD